MSDVVLPWDSDAGGTTTDERIKALGKRVARTEAAVFWKPERIRCADCREAWDQPWGVQ